MRKNLRNNKKLISIDDGLKIQHVFNLVEYMSVNKENLFDWRLGQASLGTIFPLKLHRGAYRACVLFDDFVLKFSQSPTESHRLIKETDFITEMLKDDKIGRHFPIQLC